MRRARLAAGVLACAVSRVVCAQVAFGGYEWYVRDGSGGPGPNTFAASNVAIDANGWLHLKIAHAHGNWTTAEVFTTASLGFGTYQFELVGRPDQLDANVVLGLFDYPTPDVGPDTTNEIDIEFATWSGAQAEHGNWTVWPALLQAGLTRTTHAYDATLAGDTSTHRFTWLPTSIHFESLDGFSDDASGLYHSWTFAPADYAGRIPQQAIPVHMNLWLFQGSAPTDNQDVDIAIAGFKFVPECIFANGLDDAGTACRFGSQGVAAPAETYR